MGANTHTYKYAAALMLLGCLCLGLPAAAQVPPLTPLKYKVKYDVAWNGIGIGRIRVEIAEDTFNYHASVDTKTSGIMRLISAERRTVKVTGRRVEDKYVPQHYESLDNKDGDHTSLTYDEAGALTQRVRVPDDDPKWRPPVPRADANTAIDPVTAFFVLRQMMHDNMARNIRDNQVRTYEGARLAIMSFKVISPASLKIFGKSTRAINVVAARTPLNGYTPKELKKYKAGDPVIHVYFSADERFIPLKAEIALPFGQLTATLAELQ